MKKNNVIKVLGVVGICAVVGYVISTFMRKDEKKEEEFCTIGECLTFEEVLDLFYNGYRIRVIGDDDKDFILETETELGTCPFFNVEAYNSIDKTITINPVVRG